MIELPLKEFKYIPIIGGPTASGKSGLALDFCASVGGELISSDSMQIYRGLDIGTAKDSPSDMAKVPHHMIDIIDPDKSFSVSDYQTMAYSEIDKVLSTGKLPVVCGGTGQYISALYDGINYLEVDVPQEMIDSMFEDFNANGIDAMYDELCSVDPEAASNMHKNNTRRVIRALAVYRSTGKTFTAWNRESKKEGPRYPFKLFALNIDRAVLYDRINSRVDIMMNDGLVDEVRNLMESGTLSRSSTCIQAIGYKEIVSYLDGNISLDEAVYEIKLRSRHYAKRQLTWFRYMNGLILLDPDSREAQFTKIMEEIR